jgi:hypothetical protein
MTDARKNEPITKGRRLFGPGNPGRPKGSRNRTTMAMEALLDGEAETLTRKAIDLAKQGDMAALRLCMERIVPPRKDRPVRFKMPNLETAADAVKAAAALVTAVASGDLTPAEAAELSKLVEGFVRAVEQHDVQRRLDKIEATLEQHRKGASP